MTKNEFIDELTLKSNNPKLKKQITNICSLRIDKLVSEGYTPEDAINKIDGDEVIKQARLEHQSKMISNTLVIVMASPIWILGLLFLCLLIVLFYILFLGLIIGVIGVAALGIVLVFLGISRLFSDGASAVAGLGIGLILVGGLVVLFPIMIEGIKFIFKYSLSVLKSLYFKVKEMVINVIH